MLERFWARRKDDEGFTLIELMVVVLIIGILIAIALPTFLGARTRSQNRAAQSDLRNALAAAKTFYTDGNTYAPTAPATIVTVLQDIEPSLTFQAAASTAATDYAVSVASDDDSFAAARLSASGTCYAIVDQTVTAAPITAGTYRTSPAACDGATHLAVTAGDGSW